VTPGDRVAFHGVNHPMALTSLFASVATGAIWVPIHPQRPEHEVLSILEDAEPALLVRASPQTQPPTEVPEVDVAELESLPRDVPLPEHGPGPDDLAILAYTSGTTGSPKGAMLTHGNITWAVVQMLQACAFAPTDVTLAAAPFTRMGGIGVTVLPTLFVGGSVVVPSTTDGTDILDTIEQARVTVLFANPDLLEGMRRSPRWDEADMSSVRTGVVGGGMVPEPLLRAYLDQGVRLRHGYGLTEASPAVSLLDERDAATRPDSVGKPLPFVEVRSVRPDGSECEPNEVGEWQIRGPNVCVGYWRRDPPHRAGGWLPTGDVGSIDAGGYLTILDRASSAMAVDGSIVYPASIERAVYGTEGVIDAAVVQVDGRLVLAVVEQPGSRLDVEAILTSLRARLRPSEVPAEVRRVAAVPRNQAGKVLRAALCERFSL
jgi:acyl-CoA synthetase (AMP-forming)/AMP-acid ligase II